MPIILCIEDNEKYLRLRKAVLEKEGYAVLSATDSQQAIEMLLEAPVSLVLSDHMLRGTTGVELAQHMKALKPERHVSGKFLSAMAGLRLIPYREGFRTTLLRSSVAIIR